MSNDRIILDQILKQTKDSRAKSMSDSAFFELFAAEQVLKDFDLSDEEIESGLVGDGGDGGIDGFFILANGELVREDYDSSHLRKEVVLEVVLVQAKTSAGFAETPIERFLTASDDIFDLAKGLGDIKNAYNSAVFEAIARFRDLYTDLASRFPRLDVRFVYASRGDAAEAGTLRKAEKLHDLVKARFSTADVRIDFLGAPHLLALARKTTKSTHTLKLAENPVSSTGDVGFVALVNLSDYFAFITDEKGNLRRYIFESNVRDYQGHTAVNEEIQKTLKNASSEDFWWLNNGVTVLAGRASLSAKELTIEDPQIVNGLQSSSEIFSFFKESNTSNEKRKLLVRVIVPSDPASRDRIIKATNSQTSVLPASLRATDKIHRDIEEFLRPRGLYYDRRKNLYRNEGKPVNSIIGIPQLAQAIMAILLAKPDQARARPSSLLKDDADYQKVFSTGYPIAVYFVAAALMRRVEDYLRASGLSARDWTNLRYYVAMHAVFAHFGKWRPTPKELSELDPKSIADSQITSALAAVREKFIALGGTDQAAKGPELLKQLSITLGGPSTP